MFGSVEGVVSEDHSYSDSASSLRPSLLPAAHYWLVGFVEQPALLPLLTKKRVRRRHLFEEIDNAALWQHPSRRFSVIIAACWELGDHFFVREPWIREPR